MPATLGNEIALLPREKPYGPERAEEIEPRGSMPGLSKTVHRPLFVRKVVETLRAAILNAMSVKST